MCESYGEQVAEEGRDNAPEMEAMNLTRYMISGTRVVNCTVNEDEIKALGNQGIATYESKQEACLALIDWLTFEIQIATQDVRQLGGASGS